ncbi:MAG: YihY family inner membrane protein [Tannerella sp.]|jgi:membrane protein|nr:YihY family inner membrane protein [Tannerella sp.]
MEKIKQWIEFIKNGIWQNNEKSGKYRFLRIIAYTIKGIEKHNLNISSAALTFYTLMSFVPIVAVIFAILKGFGFEQNLTEYLYSNLPEYSNVIDVFLDFVNRMLVKTRGGIIAAVGVAVLLWSVLKVFGNIEDAFNRIWEVRKARSMARKFGDYISVIFIAPILLVSSLSLGTVIRNMLSFLSVSWIVDVLLWLVSFFLIWILFAFIYWQMPNAKVQFKGAFFAGIIAGSSFLIFSLVYFFIQGEVSSYNAIYGTFAALPLFLAWMQTSWLILLVGGEISFVYQNINSFEQEQFIENMDADHKRKAVLATMVCIIKHFITYEGAVSPGEIAAMLNLPVGVVHDLIIDLTEVGLVVEVAADNNYIPAKDIHEITVSEVLDKIEKRNPDPDFTTYPEIKAISELLDDMRKKAFDPNLDKHLIDII